MKKLFPVFVCLILVLAFFLFSKKTTKKELPEKNIKKIITPTVETKKTEFVTEDLFVPYWTLDDDFVLDNNYDRIFFFDPDLSHVKKFVNQTENISNKKILVIKINDYDQMNEKLKNDAITIVNESGLSGIALDLEIPMIITEENKEQINKFVKYFYTAAKENYKSFSTIMYGDLFYRKRGYDLAFINQYSDEILVMAYDFHKASGEPGPNFPFSASEKYDYDFKLMIEDYLKSVPAAKLNVIFGMYGYDWAVDNQKRPLKPARALTFNEIKKEFLDKCQWKSCLATRDKISKETEINYVVSYELGDGLTGEDLHIIWFEDEQSAKIKIEYLKEKGIGKISYWAYGYF